MIIKEIKNEFYRIFSGMYSTKKCAVPIAPEEYSHMDIPESGYQENWNPITFLKLKEDSPIPDLVSTDICGRICSSKLRLIIDKHRTSADNDIQWLPMIIEDQETKDKVEYYYLHFPEICDTLDLNNSIFSKLGTAVKAAFSYEKVKNRSIFNCQGGEIYTCISSQLKEEIFRSGCTGITIDPVIVIKTFNEKKAS